MQNTEETIKFFFNLGRWKRTVPLQRIYLQIQRLLPESQKAVATVTVVSEVGDSPQRGEKIV